MDRRNKEPSIWLTPWRWSRWTWATIIMLMLAYPLSIGPVARASFRGYLPPEASGAMIIVYFPVTATAKQCDPLANVLEWYIIWWIAAPIAIDDMWWNGVPVAIE